MNLSRVKVWTAEILYASDLNAEFNNIINHEIDNDDIKAAAGIEGSKLKAGDIDLTSRVKGILPVANGGTGVSGDTYDADKVDGIHAAVNPSANKLCPLDSSAKCKSIPAVCITAAYYEPDNCCVLALAGYNHDPATAATFKDSSVYGNDFDIVSAYGEQSGIVSKTCLRLLGTDDYIKRDAANCANFGDMDNISIEMWVKLDSEDVTQFLMDNEPSGIGYIKLETDNQIKAFLRVGTGNAEVICTTVLGHVDFYYVVMTYDITSHTLKIYINGVEEHTDDSKSGDVNAATGSEFAIGRDVSGDEYYFNGKIDGFRILRRCMSAAEILARYNAFK